MYSKSRINRKQGKNQEITVHNKDQYLVIKDLAKALTSSGSDYFLLETHSKIPDLIRALRFISISASMQP